MDIGLSLGSDLGDRGKNIAAAKTYISAITGVEIVAESSLYETEPVNMAIEFAQMNFLNAVIIINSDIEPLDLREQFQKIENKLGREQAKGPNKPRPIDIDIIYAGVMQIATPHLTIPHPRWRSRRFVVEPLAELRPELIIPGETLTISDILLSLPDTPKVVRYA